MFIETFTPQSGNLCYTARIQHPTGDLLYFGFGASGTGADDILHKKLTFSGSSGKLYDQDGNFFLGLHDDLTVNISGNIFSGRQSYFAGFPPTAPPPSVENWQGNYGSQIYSLITNSASRTTGALNCVFYDSSAFQAGSHEATGGAGGTVFGIKIRADETIYIN